MNKSSKIIIGVVVLALVVWAIVAGTRTSPKSQSDQTIVAILPLSGPIAYTGELAKRGIDMAVADLASTTKIKVIYEDAKGDPKLAVSAFNKDVVSGNVPAAITLGSPIAMALLPLANENKAVVMGIASAPAFASPDGYTFRLSGSADVEMTNIVKNITDLKIVRPAIIYQNDDYGRGLLNGFKAKYAKSLVAEEGFLPAAADMRSELLKIKAANPDGIFIAAYAPTAGVIAKQAKALGIQSTLMCGSACDISDLIKSGGSSVEGFIVTAPTAVTSPDFAARYHTLYNDDLNYVTTRNYDAVMIIANAMAACSREEAQGTCMKDKIHADKDFPGTSFPINFDGNGNIQDKFVVKKVINGVLQTQ